MILNEEREGWHYLAVKTLSALLHRITSKNKSNFYCFNYFHYFRTEYFLKSHETVYKNKNFCRILISPEKDNLLEFKQYVKSGKNAIHPLC